MKKVIIPVLAAVVLTSCGASKTSTETSGSSVVSLKYTIKRFSLLIKKLKQKI
jgi:hypothetical protein